MRFRYKHYLNFGVVATLLTSMRTDDLVQTFPIATLGPGSRW